MSPPSLGTRLKHAIAGTPRRRRVAGLLALALGTFLVGYALTALVFLGASRPDVVTVPELRELSEPEARRRLEELGLRLGRGTALHHPSIREGAVIAQSPLPGSEIAPGSEVQVNLSRGPDRARVPDVRTLQAERARQVLERSGFSVELRERPDRRARGRIVTLEPAPGTVVNVPSRVVLVLSSGPPLVAVPAIGGQAEEAARLLLDQAGLRLQVGGYDPGSTQPPGVVVSQSPGPGASLPAGSVVVVTLAGPAPPAPPAEPAAEEPPPATQGAATAAPVG